MRVGIYSGLRNVGARALGEGFSDARVSHRNIVYYRGEVEDFDLVVTLAFREGRRVFERYRDVCPVVVADWGYLARVSHTGESASGHWQISLGGLNNIPPFACPPDRFDALGLTIAKQGGDPKGYVLICGQVPGDAAHGLDADSYLNWLREIVSQYPDAVYRPHPRGGIDLPGVESHTGSLEEALAGARLVVTWNSNVGHDALLAGVPVVAHGPAAYSELTGETLPSVDARREYFHRVAYGQWTLAEMRSGLCQRFVLDHLLTGVGPAQEGSVEDAQDAHTAPDLDAMTAEELHALAKERGIKVHPRTGAEKVRAALREAA